MMKKSFTSAILFTLFFHCLSGAELDRQWTIYLVQQTHTDIGYTRPQSEILSEHLRYIDYALDFCDLTVDYPEEARFKWTCEAAWAVEEYIKQRPVKQIERLRDCIKRGQIEVTGMYFNLSEIADEESLRYFLHPLCSIRKAGIKVTAAMQNDVNGAAWCMTDYLHDMGVKYFWMGINQTRSVLPFKIPTIFKWESPSGNEIIAFRSMHYMTANFWGIEKNDSVKFNVESKNFLNEIASKGYPYDAIGIQHLGYYVDNAPPSCKSCDFVREWNATHDNPKLRTATASEFLDYICSKYGTDNLPVQRVAWPDWWTDGFGSAAKETGEARKAHADMTAVTGLFSLASMAGDKLPEKLNDEIECAYNNLLFYDEHTFGASESIKDPGCWNSQIQFDNKASYAWTGLRKARLLYETAGGLLQEHICPYSDAASLTLFNPMVRERDACAEVFADYDIIPVGKEVTLIAENGARAEIQEVKKAREGRYFKIFARKVPSLGYRTYKIVLEDAAPEARKTALTDVLENDYYRIRFDTARGGIVSIKDKLNADRELVNTENEWPLGAFIYEKLETRNSLKRFKSEGFTREIWKNVSLKAGVSGTGIFHSIVMTGNSPAADERGVSCEVRLYDNEPRIELRYKIRRPAEFKENSIYIAFPFTKENPNLAIDVQGGVMNPGENQLEGSSCEWYTMQNFIAARSDNHQIMLSSREIPLAMLGNLLQDAPLHYLKTYDEPSVYSWVMNNYWFTNFKASQQDEFSWSYVLTSSAADKDNADRIAYNATASERCGLYGRIIPPKKTGQKLPFEKSLLELDASSRNIVVTNCAPAAFRKGIILQIRNFGPTAGRFSLKGADGRALRMTKINALEESVGKPSTGITIESGENIFVSVGKQLFCN